MNRQTAQETIAQVEDVRSQTMSDLQAPWFPLVLFGAAAVVSAAVVAIWGGNALGFFWLIAGLGGGAATARYYYVREMRIGVVGRAWPHVATSVFLFFGAFGLGMAGGIAGNDTLAYAGPVVVTAVALLVFAWLESRISMAIVAVAMLVIGGIFAVAGVGTRAEAITLILLYGSVMLATGIFYRLTGDGRVSR